MAGVDAAERAVEGACGVVVDDDGGGACSARGLGLLAEGAGAAADQGDLALGVDAVPGGGVATLLVRGLDQRGGDAGGRGARAVGHRVLLHRALLRGDHGEAGGAHLLEDEVEVLTLGRVTGRAHLALDVLGGLFVPAGAGGAVVVVGLGDGLELVEVGHDALGRHGLAQLLGALQGLVRRGGGSGGGRSDATGEKAGDGQGDGRGATGVPHRGTSGVGSLTGMRLGVRRLGKSWTSRPEFPDVVRRAGVPAGRTAAVGR